MSTLEKGISLQDETVTYRLHKQINSSKWSSQLLWMEDWKTILLIHIRALHLNFLFYSSHSFPGVPRFQVFLSEYLTCSTACEGSTTTERFSNNNNNNNKQSQDFIIVYIQYIHIHTSCVYQEIQCQDTMRSN